MGESLRERRGREATRCDGAWQQAGHVAATAKHFLGDGATREGVDQGDSRASEAELIRVRAPGYVAAIDAGVLTVMASYSSWQGQKTHGNRVLLTDVLKGRFHCAASMTKCGGWTISWQGNDTTKRSHRSPADCRAFTWIASAGQVARQRLQRRQRRERCSLGAQDPRP